MNEKNDYIPLKYDSRALNQDVHIADVISRFSGVKVNLRGNMSCPSTQHSDKTPSAHIYPKTNNCKCFSCGGNFKPIDLVMDNLNVDFPTACQTLIEEFNLQPERYSNIEEIREIRRQQKVAVTEKRHYEIFPFSQNELKTIGLEGGMDRTVPNVISVQDEYGFNDEVQLGADFQFDSLIDIWKKGSDDKEWVESLILQKINETIEACNDSIDNLLHIKQTAEMSLSKYNPKYVENLYNLYGKCLFENRKPVLNNEQLSIITHQTNIDKALETIPKLQIVIDDVERISDKFRQFIFVRTEKKEKGMEIRP